jgi:hypothetical protein
MRGFLLFISRRGCLHTTLWATICSIPYQVNRVIGKDMAQREDDSDQSCLSPGYGEDVRVWRTGVRDDIRLQTNEADP